MERRFEPLVFYADESQCAEWDAALLAEHPTLADEDGWRAESGWYWLILDSERREVIDEGGPYASAAECRVQWGRALERLLTGLSPEQVADTVADALYDDGSHVFGFSRASGRDRGKNRWCKRSARHSPRDILGRLGDGSNRRGNCSARLSDRSSEGKLQFALVTNLPLRNLDAPTRDGPGHC